MSNIDLVRSQSSNACLWEGLHWKTNFNEWIDVHGPRVRGNLKYDKEQAFKSHNVLLCTLFMLLFMLCICSLDDGGLVPVCREVYTYEWWIGYCKHVLWNFLLVFVKKLPVLLIYDSLHCSKWNISLFLRYIITTKVMVNVHYPCYALYIFLCSGTYSSLWPKNDSKDSFDFS